MVVSFVWPRPPVFQGHSQRGRPSCAALLQHKTSPHVRGGTCTVPAQRINWAFDYRKRKSGKLMAVRQARARSAPVCQCPTCNPQTLVQHDGRAARSERSLVLASQSRYAFCQSLLCQPCMRYTQTHIRAAPAYAQEGAASLRCMGHLHCSAQPTWMCSCAAVSVPPFSMCAQIIQEGAPHCSTPRPVSWKVNLALKPQVVCHLCTHQRPRKRSGPRKNHCGRPRGGSDATYLLLGWLCSCTPRPSAHMAPPRASALCPNRPTNTQAVERREAGRPSGRPQSGPT